MPRRKWLPLDRISILHASRELAEAEKQELAKWHPEYDFRLSWMPRLNGYRVLAARKEAM